MPVQPSSEELEHIRYALDQSAIVAITDVPGRITYANEKFCEISKYRRDELLGQDHRILNSGFHSADFMRDLWRTIAQGQIWKGELRNRAKDGSLYWVDTTIVPFVDDRGKPWQYMAIRYDITERKRQEARLLEQATLSSLGEMVAVLAHEVRNPLAGIRGGVQVLDTMFAVGTEGRDLTRDIVARIDSLNAVLSDLLSFARIRRINAAQVDVTTFFTDLGSALRLDPDMHGVSLSVEGETGIHVEADVDHLRLVFTNLLLNAAQAMKGQGRIIVSAKRHGDDWVALTIADTGPGIPAELRQRVLEPFFTTKVRGTGLGLPTARRIVEAHGGTLTIGETAAGGAVLQILLPSHARPATNE